MEKVPIRLGRLRTSVREAPPTATADALSHCIQVHSSANGTSSLLRTASSGRVCRVCTTHESRYTCPRCNLPYCSVGCYRSHGTSCTEQFYQEHVANEMSFDERATASVDPKAQRQRTTEELLTRVKQFHDETSRAFDNGDSDAEDSQAEVSAERLAQLALLLDDAELSLECLTLEERTRFLADVAGGHMSKYVMPWEPWWRMGVVMYERETATRRRKLIIEITESPRGNKENEELGDDDNAPSAAEIEVSRFPAAIFTRDMEQGIPVSVQSLVRGTVSPCLTFHLVEILFAYAFTMRTFNGDWQQDPEDAALAILHYSDVLRDDGRFATLEAVVLKCLEQRDSDGSQQAATNRLVISDVAELLDHRVFILDALSDLKQLLSDAVETIRTTRRSSANTKTARGSKQDRAAVKKLQGVEKKIHFYLIWRCRADSTASDLLEISTAVRSTLATVAHRGSP